MNVYGMSYQERKTALVNELNDKLADAIEQLCEKYGVDEDKVRHLFFSFIKEDDDTEAIYGFQLEVENEAEFISALDTIEEKYYECVNEDPMNWFGIN